MERLIAAARKNVALIVALVALGGTIGGGYASYALVREQVANNREMILDNRTSLKEVAKIVTDHEKDTAKHLDSQKWQLLMDRLKGIEDAVNRLK
uniref:Uncharacterized protein n=1 Tax=viral metagenome TaxID=1070528 RepID=A0A6M3K1R4_9ZZZZ